MIRGILFSILIATLLYGCSSEQYACGDYTRRYEFGTTHLKLNQDSTFCFYYASDRMYCICGTRAWGTPPAFPNVGYYRIKDDSVFLHYNPRPAYQSCKTVDSSWFVRLDDGLFIVRDTVYEVCMMMPDSFKVDVAYYYLGNVYSSKEQGRYKKPYIESNDIHPTPANVEEAFFRRYYLN